MTSKTAYNMIILPHLESTFTPSTHTLNIWSTTVYDDKVCVKFYDYRPNSEISGKIHESLK